jgi:ABC-type sugar transport system ATPase subunit
MADDHLKPSTNHIEFLEVSRSFPGVQALAGVSFSIRRGEIHALVGENGAGKSTLINICCGVLRPDNGHVIVNGSPVHFESTKDAERHGFATVFQEIPICHNMTVAQNVFLGPAPATRHGFLNSAFMNSETRELLRIFDIRRQPDDIMGVLSLAEQSMVQVLRATYARPDFLILDEPTSSLSVEQKRMLFDLLKRLRNERALTVLYVSHKMDEVFEISNRISVLKDGHYIATVDTVGVDHETIIKMMVGRNIEKHVYKRNSVPQETVVEVNHLTRTSVLENITFSIRRGEIVGLAGLQGAGRTELGRAIFGADRIDSGSISIDGKQVSPGNVRHAMRLGIAMISENRRDEGIIPALSVRDNLILVFFRKASRLGILNGSVIKRIVDSYIDMLRIKLSSQLQRIESLSGGNQQKVIIARWLANNPKLLICDELTRGIDVGAKSELQETLFDLAKKGLTVLLISSEMPELLSICDRIMVMHNGRITGELSHEEATEEKILVLATA